MIVENSEVNSLIPQEIWINVKALADLKGVTERAIRLNISRYTSRKENGSYEILLSSIDPELQEKHKNEQYKNLLFEELGETIEPIRLEQDQLIPEESKRIALARLDLLNLWNDFRQQYPKITQGNKDFLTLYNTGQLHENLYDTLGHVAIGTIYRWKLAIGDPKSGDWTKLAPAYKYTGHKTTRTTLTDEEITLFLKILLHPNKFKVGKAINLTRYILHKRGYQAIPKYATFKRYADWFKKHNYDKWVLAREGEKALKDKVEPYIVRDASILEVGEVLVADGHRLNFQVLNPFTGKPVRATLVGFLDWKSTALVGYEIMLEENTQCIASALRNSILNFGRIPKIAYQDNGNAFKAKFFTGDDKFEELGFVGIYGNLGIQPVFAAPYNARAKVIERFFLEFQESFEKMMPSYIGTSIDNKPAYMRRNEKLHREIHNGYIPTIEEAIRMIDCWLEYKHSQPCSNVQGKTIQEVLDTVQKQRIDINKLDDLMMAQEIKTIHRNGIRFLKADYYDDSLYGFRGKVIIRYSLFDLSFVKVYSLKNEFICHASRVMPTHPMAKHLGDIKDVEDYKQKVVKHQKLRSKTIKEVRKLFTHEEIVEFSRKQALENQSELEIQQKEEVKFLTTNKIPALETKPIFKTKYERYEWFMNNGCCNDEERQWMEKYKNSDEYKLIYEDIL